MTTEPTLSLAALSPRLRHYRAAFGASTSPRTLTKRSLYEMGQNINAEEDAIAEAIQHLRNKHRLVLNARKEIEGLSKELDLKDGFATGTILRWVMTFRNSSKEYDYAAIKSNTGRWSTTGPKSPKDYPYGELIDWISLDRHTLVTDLVAIRPDGTSTVVLPSAAKRARAASRAVQNQHPSVADFVPESVVQEVDELYIDPWY